MSKLTPPEDYLKWVKNQIQYKFGDESEPKKVFVNPDYYEDNGFPGDANKEFHIWDFQEAFDRLFSHSDYELNKNISAEFKYIEPDREPKRYCDNCNRHSLYDETNDEYYCPICKGKKSVFNY